MTEVAAAVISDVLGAKLTDDKAHVLVGLKQPDGAEFTLAMSEMALPQILRSLVRVLDDFAPANKLSEQRILAIDSDWFNLGKETETENFVLQFRAQGGGHIAFRMNGTMAKQLAEVMNVAVLGATIQAPADSARN
jgi:hypothetical protein